MAPGQAVDHSRAFADSGVWYDLGVTADEAPDFLRRFVGRLEAGSESISDPAMGLGV